MFTGIVEAIGTILEYKEFDDTESGGSGISLTIGDAGQILGDCHIGDSIAVNGICLTVTEFDSNSFKVGISPETVKRTNVSDLKSHDKVNLERAVSQDVRFGGHYVQGHVDTVADIVSNKPEGNSIVFGFKLRDPEYNKFIVEKGFICIDGTSLTVTEVNDQDEFFISMIKHTQENVIMPLKSLNDKVNIEVDVTAKVIEKQIVNVLDSQIVKTDSVLNQYISKLLDEKLKEHFSK